MDEIYYLVVENFSINTLYRDNHTHHMMPLVGATYSFRELINWAVKTFDTNPFAEINEIRGDVLKGGWVVIELPTIH